MQSNAIQWTAREYGLKEFLRKFRTSLSKVVKVTEGYLGRQEVDTLSASTILRIHCLYSQKRAIVECKNGSILSIPVTLESMMFNVADQKHKTGPFTMKEVLLYFNLPVTVTSTNDLTYREMNNPGSKEQQLKQLIVKRTYEQEFLLGHPINDSDITLLDKDKLDQYTGEYAEIEPIYIDLNPQNPGYKYQVKQPRQSLAEAPNDNLVQSHGENKPQIPPKPNRETGSSCLVAGPTLRIKPLFKTSRRSSYIQKQKAKRIVSMSEVPDDLQHLNVDEVCDCLNLLNMGKYIETFQSQQIDGHLLFDLDRDIMQNTFGMSNFHILKMIRFREGWRPK
ncbi:uncharacterized protein LOC121271973 isoform X2 [Carcharodon carcharias]|uniref:uncharacterized protein LOC121271973 isoform X2 n=1 Tax=Carcharodon carcharias TaxID=13397 RepID=UPI001B7E6B05|nr:uncharacterized protein LOC121271973 isoform X2 [Carcharodon carcharias]